MSHKQHIPSKLDAETMINHTKQAKQAMSNNVTINDNPASATTQPTTQKRVKTTENKLDMLNKKLNKKSKSRSGSKNNYMTNKELKKIIQFDDNDHIIFNGFSPKISRTIRVYPELYALFTNLGKGTFSQTINEALIDFLLAKDVITPDVAQEMREQNS